MLFREIRKRMEFFTKRIDDSLDFLMCPCGYGMNKYKFIEGVLHIYSCSKTKYVIADISLNSLLSDEFRVYMYE